MDPSLGLSDIYLSQSDGFREGTPRGKAPVPRVLWQHLQRHLQHTLTVDTGGCFPSSNPTS